MSRKRSVKLEFWVTPDEKAQIEQKMAELGTENLSAYLRKMAIDGRILKLDLPELRELLSLMRRYSGNLNQIAKRKPSLLIDIQAKLAEGKGAGYERWAKVFNLKQMAQTISFLKENGNMDFDELSRRAEAASEKCSALTEKLKATEARMSEVEELKKQVINYLRTRETFRAYKASGYSKRYLAEHEQEILLHRAAKKRFNDRGLKKLPTVKALQAEYAALLAEKRATYPAYHEARAEMKKLLTYRANAEAILGMNANTGKRQKEHEQR